MIFQQMQVNVLTSPEELREMADELEKLDKERNEEDFSQYETISKNMGQTRICFIYDVLNK